MFNHLLKLFLNLYILFFILGQLSARIYPIALIFTIFLFLKIFFYDFKN
jgi:hypothetical protein